jgi:hypothetical protein
VATRITADSTEGCLEARGKGPAGSNQCTNQSFCECALRFRGNWAILQEHIHTVETAAPPGREPVAELDREMM